MQKSKSASKEDDDIKAMTIPKTNGLKEGGEGTTTLTGQQSEDIDYNNYFANAQKIVAVTDNYEGEEGGAEMENYYAAEVLNLKFNPNAKTRYGMLCIAILRILFRYGLISKCIGVVLFFAVCHLCLIKRSCKSLYVDVCCDSNHIIGNIGMVMVEW